jgi:hypothetical protein
VTFELRILAVMTDSKRHIDSCNNSQYYADDTTQSLGDDFGLRHEHSETCNVNTLLNPTYLDVLTL